MDTDKQIAKMLLDEQGFDVDEDRIHIPSKRCDMDLKRKTQLCNLLTAYRNDMCGEASENAEETYNMTKCEVCDMAMSDGTCIIDKILLRIENDLWEG